MPFVRPALAAPWMVALCLGVIATATPAPAEAETYPSRQVTIIIPFGAGSVTDAATRLIAQSLQDSLGQPVVVENKAGANGLLAAQTVARAAPDGYTLLITTNSTHSAAPSLYKTVPYDPIKDFTPVARIGSFPSVVVVKPDLPVKTIQELIAFAKSNPGKLEYGHGNSTSQIAGEAIKYRTGINMVRVAYRSQPAVVTDLIAGHISVAIPDFNTAMAQIKAGKMRALAVLTKERSTALPDVPTLNETIMPGFDLLAWAGMFAPADTPPEVVNTLAAELQKLLTRPDIVKKFNDVGTEIFFVGPQGFSDYVKSELVKWTAVIKQAGIEPE